MSVATLNWSSENHFTVDGVSFFATIDPSEYHSILSNDDALLILKTRAMIESEIGFVSDLEVKNIIDIGLWQGGSVALFDRLFSPDKIVAIEYSTRELPHLDAYVAKHGRSENVSINKAVSQSDVPTMSAILDAEFGEELIDIAVDDASHQYEETLASFNLIFPRMKPGGVFIIEDWNWSVRPEGYESDYFEGKPGLANLIAQCVFCCAARFDIIQEVRVTSASVAIVKGITALGSDFNIADYAHNRGEPIPMTY